MRHLHIVLDEETHDVLLKDSKQCGFSKTAYLRRLILSEPVKARPTKIVTGLYREINAIGVNINQIARNVNAGIAWESDIKQSLFLLKKVYELIERVTDL